MNRRSGYRMVEENDPHWQRFWDAYPHRVSKKEARKAWMELHPSPELVERMLNALTWQSALWERQGYGTPYPASWLRAERWTDEPPRNGHGKHAPTFTDWACPHVDECANRWRCQQATALGRPRKDGAVAS